MMKGVNLRLGAVNKGAPAMNSFSRGLKNIRTAQNGVRRSNVSFMKGMNANRRIIQQVGFQMSDVSVQIAGGQSAILALTQNVPQVVQMFGAMGGILAALITIIGTLTLVMVRSGKSFSDFTDFLGVTQGAFADIGKAVNGFKETLFDVFNAIVNNLDVVIITLGLTLGMLAGKALVTSKIFRVLAISFRMAKIRGLGAAASFVTMRIAASLLGKTMIVLTKIMIKTGIGALIVGVGILIERILTLNQATGDWGKTFKLVGDVIKQTFKQLPLIFTGLFFKIQEGNLKIAASFFEMTASILSAVGMIVDPFLGVFVGLKNAVAVIFIGMAAAILNPITDSINDAIDVMRDGVNKLIRFNNRIPLVIKIPIIHDDIGRVGKIIVDDTKTLGERTAAAFNDGLKGKFIGKDSALNNGLLSMSKNARAMASDMSVLGDSMFSAAGDAIPAWQELKKLLASIKDNDFDIRDLFGKDGDGDIVPGVDIAPAKKELSDFMKFILDLSNTIRNSVRENFKGLIKGTKSLKDALFSVLDRIADKLLDFSIDNLFDALIGTKTGKGIGDFFTKTLGKIFSFAGGGFTGSGSRSGGVDGKGGFAAILHPQETVIDHTKVSKSRAVGTNLNSANNNAPSITMNTVQNFNGVTREEVMSDVMKANRDQEKRLNAELPGKIAKNSFNARRGMATR